MVELNRENERMEHTSIAKLNLCEINQHGKIESRKKIDRIR